MTAAWWVAAQSQLAQARGLLTFEEKERYTFNCTYTFAAPLEKEPAELYVQMFFLLE